MSESAQALTDFQVIRKEIETENNSKNTRMRWTKEVNNTVMRCLDQSDPTKRIFKGNNEHLGRNRIIYNNRTETSRSN